MSHFSQRKCTLMLSDGSQFEGGLIGAPIHSSGELVFTTAMVGYAESITDPSYFGQILIFAYPLIGNYGVPSIPQGLQIPIPNGFESGKVHAAGVIVGTDSRDAYHWSSFQTLDRCLQEQGVSGITGLDTRHLIHKIRDAQGLGAKIVPEGAENSNGFYDPSSENVVQFVSTPERKRLGKGKRRIAVIDCGIKWNIIRQLLAQDVELELLPWNTDLAQVDCDAWVLSNGPGDPQKTGQLSTQVRKLLLNEGHSKKNVRPVLGICLGHQILALAAGARTERLPYGHRSHNQPVQLVGTRKGFITSQNHGYVVVESSLPAHWKKWFINANDGTIEGIRHESLPFQSVQFHPEAAGGPRDTGWIIEDFLKCL